MLLELSVQGAGWEEAWVESSGLDCSLLSRLLRVREAAGEERKPRVSESEGACKVSAAQNAFIVCAAEASTLNAFIMYLLRDCLTSCMFPLAENSLPSISEIISFFFSFF